MSKIVSRRRFLIGSAAALGAVGLTGCDDVTQNQSVQKVLALAEELDDAHAAPARLAADTRPRIYR